MNKKPKNPYLQKHPQFADIPPEKVSWEKAFLEAEHERRKKESKKKYKERIDRLQRKIKAK